MDLKASRAVMEIFTDDGVNLIEPWSAIAKKMSESGDPRERQQAQALRDLDTTAMDPKFLRKQLKTWEDRNV